MKTRMSLRLTWLVMLFLALSVQHVAAQEMSPATFAQKMKSARNVTYVNKRFNFKFVFPDCFKTFGEASTNGDGRVFICGDAVLSIHASRNAQGWNIQRAFKEWAFYPTYKKLGKDYYIASGYEQSGEIYYVKCVLKNGVFYTVQLDYPKGYQKSLNALIRRIANFKP